MSQEIPGPLITGPFTIAYIVENGDSFTISTKEYKHLESVFAFIHGRNLIVGNYVVMEGHLITNVNDLIKESEET